MTDATILCTSFFFIHSLAVPEESTLMCSSTERRQQLLPFLHRWYSSPPTIQLPQRKLTSYMCYFVVAPASSAAPTFPLTNLLSFKGSTLVLHRNKAHMWHSEILTIYKKNLKAKLFNFNCLSKLYKMYCIMALIMAQSWSALLKWTLYYHLSSPESVTLSNCMKRHGCRYMKNGVSSLLVHMPHSHEGCGGTSFHLCQAISHCIWD